MLHSDHHLTTKLNRYFILGIICWTALIGSSLFWSFHLVQQETIGLAKKEALTIYDKDIAYRHWATMHGGVYVPAAKRTPSDRKSVV